jgi:RNA polymerase sigma-70 factor (ECF subfamily)
MSSDLPADRFERAYLAHRPALLGLSYRMLGSFADAEDVVQEAFLRFKSRLTSGEAVNSERAYLTAMTTRLCIDHLRSARVRRETYVGPWLPEPAVEGLTDLANDVALSDSLSTAFLVLLERLTPEQRAVLLLRDVFGYEYGQIAKIIDKTPVACRQLAVRARRRVREDPPRRRPAREDRVRIAEAFFQAARSGDLRPLEQLLADQARFVGDGGDSGRGISRPVEGRHQVAKLVKSLVSMTDSAGIRFHATSVGTQPAVVLLDRQDHLVGVWTLVLTTEETVQEVHGMVNPAKLGHLGLPLTELTRATRRQD